MEELTPSVNKLEIEIKQSMPKSGFLVERVN